MSTKAKSSFVEYDADKDDDMSNTDLISSHYDPTDPGDEDNQKTLPCCWCCKSEFALFCRFRIFYFMYYFAYQCGILFITKQLSKELNNPQDDYDTYYSLFMAIASFICFLFSIFLGYLSDINGRRRYMRYTVIVTIIPFFAVLIYPNIWLYFGLLPLLGFVGSTTILTGLFITYLTDVIPKEYLSAGFASIHAIEGSAGLSAICLAALLTMYSKNNYRIGLGVTFALFMLALFLCLCCISESLPLQKRNIKADSNEKWKCIKIFISTLKTNKILFFIIILYFCILFPFQGIEALIAAKSDLELLFKGDLSGVLFIIVWGGIFIGKLLNPTILCCANCCCKKIFWKIVFFMSILIIALVFFIVMAVYQPDVDAMINNAGSALLDNDCTPATYEPTYYPTTSEPSHEPTTSEPSHEPTTPYPTYSPITPWWPTYAPIDDSNEPTLEPTVYPTSPTMEPTEAPTLTPTVLPTCNPTNSSESGYVHSDPNAPLYGFIFAFVAGLVFAWSQLLVPLINVLVRGSSNKLERGKTFGVLSSIESVCTYAAPLVIMNLWETDFPISSFIICIVLVIFGFVWLWLKLKQIVMMKRSTFVEYDQNKDENTRENQGLSDKTDQGMFVL